MTDYRETETDTRFDGNLDYTFEDLDTSWLSEFEKMNKKSEKKIKKLIGIIFQKSNFDQLKPKILENKERRKLV